MYLYFQERCITTKTFFQILVAKQLVLKKLWCTTHQHLGYDWVS